MGVTFPGSFCHDSTAHHWIGVEHICSGVLFRCTLCHRHIWLPGYYTDAETLCAMIRQLGDTEGYCQFLNHASRRQAKILVAKLQELESISQRIADSEEIARIAVKILDQKNYDRM